MKKKLVLTLATSPKAYAYFAKYKQSWPKPFEPIPSDIKEIMGEFLSTYYPENHKSHEHGYLVFPTEASIKAKEKTKAHTHFQESWFTCTNVAFGEGEQLPCVALISLKNFYITTLSLFQLTKLLNLRKAISRALSKLFKFRDIFYITAIALLITALFYYT